MNRYRYNDYYEMQETFDELYNKSLEGHEFKNLFNIISSENNIKLAFRMIKSNTGSNTAGTDGLTIKDIKKTDVDKYVEMVQEKLKWFKPDTVKRVIIPKENGKKRPLGIPTMIDRLIQQCFKQVLEPICEAKFYSQSYGFRPNRSTRDAFGAFQRLVNMNGHKYVVDIDIKGFFDNVNHNKLIKQMYTLGIRDRKVLSIIRTMLKAPIQGEGIPEKGTPQGGILSPLLSNIVLNELDWWIASQWEHFPASQKNYTINSWKFRELRSSTNLKEVHIVRYADDFKLFCKNYNHAKRIFEATKKWLKNRLGLEISPDKSQIVNLRKNYSEFLGYKFKAYEKKTAKCGQVTRGHIKDSAMKRISTKLKAQVKVLVEDPSPKEVNKYNSMILGIQEYYRGATEATEDFRKIAFTVNRFMFNRLKDVAKYKFPTSNRHGTYQKIYGKSKSKTWIIGGCPIYPIHYCRPTTWLPMNQKVCDYTENGRKLSSKALEHKTNSKVQSLMKSYIIGKSVEYNDNRISRASMANFKCEVTGQELEVNEIHCHHKIPTYMGGTDDFDNLRIVHEDIHKLIHATKDATIQKYVHLITSRKALKKINELRSFCKLKEITLNDN
ncbi:group II intron reverse transcriptase/maturase [Bacillus cereus]|uniref:group II intron reverse transcriptase/maturase n=2 Tax=Bacillus cereus group TaxID=86661 RepID=UPI001443B946|nr:group II intron reverse transcriptase/maturase [Bacillus cereus]NKX03319.1 group II intron reverse transcriptase/maturase [Bacillus cereus]